MGAAGPLTRGEPALPGHLFAGPEDQPDRWELLGAGMIGGEGTTWQARYAGRLSLPASVRSQDAAPATPARRDWPDESDLQRWADQVAVLRHLDPVRVVRVFSVTVGPPPHRRGEHASEIASAPAARPVVYLEMEWLDGPTLDAAVRGEPVSAATLADRLHYIEQAAEAVADLHSRTRTGGNPALHRDLKPGNCVVDGGRGLVLIDLSSLRLTDDGVDPLGRHSPGYTAPEVLAKPTRARDPSSDVYSLGALAMFCVTGEDPPQVTTRATARLARQVRTVACASGIRRASEFADLLIAAVHADPERRPADVRKWALELAALTGSAETRVRRRHRSGSVRRRRVVPAAVSGVAAAVAAGALIMSQLEAGTGPGVVAGPAGRTVGAPAHGLNPSPTHLGTAGSGPAPSPVPRGATTPAGVPPAEPSATTGTRAASPRPAGPARPTTAAPVRAVGAIAVPADGSMVPQCAYFSGTATVPPGRTLVLAMQNISNGDTTQYVEFVFGWQTPPPSPWPWRGAQFFGSGDTSAGQRYRVRLMAVALDDARRVGAKPAIAALGTPLATVELTRVTGAGPNGCVGP